MGSLNENSLFQSQEVVGHRKRRHSPVMRIRFFAAAFAISACLNAALVPVLVNEHLRFTYVHTLSHWRSKIDPPTYVFMGDSITAGGRMFARWDTINLASNGLRTAQVRAALPLAQSYNPEHIVVMAGTNDALSGPLEEESLTRLWREIVADPRVIVTLAPCARDPTTSNRVRRANAIAANAARQAGRPVIALNEVCGLNGLVQPRYSTDGVHLESEAYGVWRQKLRALET